MFLCCRCFKGNKSEEEPPRLSLPQYNLPPPIIIEPPLPQNCETSSEQVNEIYEVNQEKDPVIPTTNNLTVDRPKLEDYGSTEDLKELTVKQMKVLLALYRVDFRGCLEKKELQEKVYQLWEDNNKHKDIVENTPTERLCKICMDAPLDCVLLECGHIASCVNCGKQLAECPICRQYVVRAVRVFKA